MARMLNCEKCGAEVPLEGSKAGTHVRCPKCDTAIAAQRAPAAEGPTAGALRLERVAMLEVPRAGELVFSEHERRLIVVAGFDASSIWDLDTWNRIDQSLLPSAKETAEMRANPSAWDPRFAVSASGKRWMMSLTKSGAFQFLTTGEHTLAFDVEAGQVLSTLHCLGQGMGLFRHTMLLGPSDIHLGVITVAMVGNAIVPASKLRIGKQRQPGTTIDLERPDFTTELHRTVKQAVFALDESRLALLFYPERAGDQITKPGQVVIYDTSTWQQVWQAERDLTGIQFVSKGGLLGWRWAVGAKEIEIVQVPLGRVVHRLEVHDSLSHCTYDGRCIVATQDGRLMVARSNSHLYLWDPRSGQVLTRLPLPHGKQVAYVSISSDRRLLAAVTGESQVEVFALRWN